MNKRTLHICLTTIIALVWLINGLYCKVLNMVPRHQQIVASIMGEKYAGLLTVLIGISEIVMAIWIISRYKSKLNSILQILIVITMNIIEFFMAPDLLMWGHINAVFAFIFIALVWYNEFVLNKSSYLMIE